MRLRVKGGGKLGHVGGLNVGLRRSDTVPSAVLLSSDSVSLNGKRLCQSERLMAG